MFILLALACVPGAARITDDHNALVETQLDVGQLASAEGSDVVVDWSELDEDILGRPLDPATVDRVELLIFNRLSQDEVVQGLVDDDLVQTDLLLYQVCEPAETACALSEFGLYGTKAPLVESFVDDGHTWLLVLGDQDRDGAVGMVFLQPSPVGEERLLLQPGDSALALSVELASRPALSVRERLEWSGLTLDLQGHALALGDLDQARLGRFEGSIEDLEDRLPDLASLAQATWTTSIEGRTSLSLSDLEGAEPFDDLDHEHTWLLALECSSCPLPLPRVLLELQP